MADWCCNPPAELEATRLQPSGDGSGAIGVVRCQQGCWWGTGTRGEQCRRAFGPSRHAQCPRPAPPRSLLTIRAAPDAGPPVPLWGIELAGLALGVAFVCAVALGHDLSNDEFWSMAAGQWMLAHHQLIGLDPFSYTESHRRWITDEWGSEIVLAEMYRAFGASAYTVYAVVLGGAEPGCKRRLRPRAGRPGRPGGRHRPVALGRARRRLRRGPGARFLPRLVPARTPAAWPRPGPTRAGSSPCPLSACCG